LAAISKFKMGVVFNFASLLSGFISEGNALAAISL
jgi:hypothetical protein